MYCLIIDTSSDLCLIAIAKDNHILSEKIFSHLNLLSKNLLPSIQEILGTVGITPSDLNLIAVGIGPGSYTGTRVGATIGKSLAFGLNIQVKPFCSLLAFLPQDQEGSFAFLVSTRNGDFFVLLGDSTAGKITQKSTALLALDAMVEAVQTTDFLISKMGELLPEGLKSKVHLLPNPNLPTLLTYLEPIEAITPEEIELQYLHTPS